MHAKNVIIAHWKLINHLKSYFAKFTTDTTFENALNKEFAHFLQKVDPKTYGKEMVRYLASQITVDQKSDKAVKVEQPEKSMISFPNVFGNMFKDEPKPVPVPKWKSAKPVVSKVGDFVIQSNYLEFSIKVILFLTGICIIKNKSCIILIGVG